MTLFGDEDSLAPFNAYQPSPVSFLPISQGQSLASSIQSRLAARAQSNSLPSPIIIQLSRRTAVDARAAGMSISEEKSHMAFTKPVGYGVIHTTNRGPNSVTFSGTFTIPPSVVNAGFATSGVQVTVSISLQAYFEPHHFPASNYITRFHFCEGGMKGEKLTLNLYRMQ